MSADRSGVCLHGRLRRSCETCDLAEDLATVEAERDALRAALKRANDSTEHFEREWYLRGDELEAAYAEMRKQWPAITAVFDRDVWERAKKAQP